MSNVSLLAKTFTHPSNQFFLRISAFVFVFNKSINAWINFLPCNTRYIGIDSLYSQNIGLGQVFVISGKLVVATLHVWQKHSAIFSIIPTFFFFYSLDIQTRQHSFRTENLSIYLLDLLSQPIIGLAKLNSVDGGKKSLEIEA